MEDKHRDRAMPSSQTMQDRAVNQARTRQTNTLAVTNQSARVSIGWIIFSKVVYFFQASCLSYYTVQGRIPTTTNRWPIKSNLRR